VAEEQSALEEVGAGVRESTRPHQGGRIGPSTLHRMLCVLNWDDARLLTELGMTETTCRAE
jgi:hypothetical protein